MIHYYQYEDGYIGVTNRSPKGMKGVVFIGRGPNPREGIESVCEQPYAKNRLERLKEVREQDVPEDWHEAIGYGKPRKPREPKLDPSINLDDDFEPVFEHAPPEWKEPVHKIVPFEPIYDYKQLKHMHRMGFVGWSLAGSVIVLMIWRVLTMG